MKKPIRIKKPKLIDDEVCGHDLFLRSEAFIQTDIDKKKKRISLRVLESYDTEPLAEVKMNLHEAKLIHAVLGVHIGQLE